MTISLIVPVSWWGWAIGVAVGALYERSER